MALGPRPEPVLCRLKAIATAFFACGCLVAYNRRLKHIPLAGNLAVSLLCGLAFFFGGFAVGAPVPAAVPALFATVYHLGREILKDAQDIPGDRIAPGMTLPLCWGPAGSCRLAAGVYAILILLTPVPYILDLYGLPYLILVSLLDVVLVCLMIPVLRVPDTRPPPHGQPAFEGGNDAGTARNPRGHAVTYGRGGIDALTRRCASPW